MFDPLKGKSNISELKKTQYDVSHRSSCGILRGNNQIAYWHRVVGHFAGSVQRRAYRQIVNGSKLINYFGCLLLFVLAKKPLLLKLYLKKCKK